MSITAYKEVYCDDVNTPDANGKTPLDKNYLRILFKPGYAVQTRELNQLQSLIQAQLDRVGESIYRSGKSVIDGRARFDDQLEIYSVDVTTSTPLTDLDTITTTYNRVTRITQGAATDSPLRAKVVKIEQISTNSYKLFLKSKNSETSVSNSNIAKYIAGDTLSLGNNQDDTVGPINLNVTAVHSSVGAHVAKGVYFVKGCYALVDEQYVASDIESNTFTGYVVLKVTEGIAATAIGTDGNVTKADNSLLDNAQGYLNYNAPGADRYYIDLTLELLSGADIPSDENYITLLKIVDDKVIVNYSEAEFTGIDDKLAKRTYEESGNYEVNPFPIHIREAYNNGTNGGLYSDDDLADNGYPTAGAASDDLVCTLDPSVAYVKGYRVQLKSSVPLKFPKARETDVLANAGVSADMGTYVDGKFETGNIPDIEKVDTVYTINNPSTKVPGTRINVGSARIRSIESNGGTSYRLFLYDIKFFAPPQPPFPPNVEQNASDYAINTNSKLILGTTISFKCETVLKNTDISESLYTLPVGPIKNIEDVRIVKKKVFDNVPVTKSGDVIDITGTLTVSLTDTGSTFDKSLSNIIVCVNGTTIITQDKITVQTSASNTLTLSLTGLPTGVVTARVITSVSATAKRGNKQLKAATRTITSPVNGLHTLTGIYHLVSVTGPVGATYEIVNDGQYDSHYDSAQIRITKTVGDTVPVVLNVTYYDFDTSDAVYYDALSYKKTVTSPGGTSIIQIPLEDIPSYKDTPLINVLDFRYVLGASQFSPIDPYSPITFDLEYYIPRVDSVVVNKTGEFSIINGIPSLDPKKPSIPDNAMELYTLNIAPYTFGPEDVNVEKIDNKRYTMSNIRSLERRISNLEYYTTLSFLEKNANDTSILDESGINRFKNGFVVDSFVGHNVSDPSEGNSVCAIDPTTNECRPAFSTESIKLEKLNTADIMPDGYSSGVHDRAITLPYTKDVYIAQNAASEYSSIVPFDSATAVGKLNLYPSADYWCETTEIKPNVVQNDSLKDAFTNLVTGLENELDVDILGTEWKSWHSYWKGIRRNELSGDYGKKVWGFRNPLKKFNWNVKFEVNQFRQGVTTSIGTNDTKVDLGERVVDLSVRPYIRRRFIYFSGNALKANTVYYPFFDGVNVASYCHSLTQAEFDAKKGTDVVGPYLPDIVATDGSQILKADEDGNLYGVFVVPDFNTTGLKFLTGEREFKLSDSVRNTASEITSYASTNYVASGMAKTVQSTILSTAVPELVRTAVKEERKLSDAFSVNNNNGGCGYQDPVAQSFLIDNDEGMFAAGIDIFFAKKSATRTPVEIYIVTCENGNPTQNVVPLSTVVKNAADVIDDITGVLPTHFEFEQPVYLSPYQEYAVVCKSTDADYMVFTATMGKPNISDGKTISKNPYMGVFFKSQNSFTWSPEQTMDLTFVLYRAKFISNSEREVVFNTPSLQSLKRIKVINAGSGYTDAPTVTIEGGGSGAAAYAVLNTNNGIAEIILTDRGAGYTSIPTVTLSAPPSTGTQATASAVMGNYQVSNFVLDQDTVEIAISDAVQSSVRNRIRILGTDYQANPDTTYEAYGSKQAWSADTNGVNRNNLVELTSTLYSTSDYITPVIDTDRMNVKLIRNNIRPEAQAVYTSRYVTRSVTLTEKADQIDIYFDVNRPSTTCDLKVYVEYDNSGTWVLIPILDPKFIPVNSNPDTFSEVRYTKESNEFQSFRVKIEFIGENIVDVPRITNFRAIATA
jgi:hypothetical protein